MNSLSLLLMVTLFFAMGQGKNHYTLASVDAILANLAKYHNVHIKRRWLFWNLRRLLDQGFIKRKPRYEHDTSGLISQIPSLITFTLKGVLQLLKMGVTGATELYKSMLAYLKKDDKRWPSRKDFDDGTYLPEDKESRARLKSLLGSVGTRI